MPLNKLHIKQIDGLQTRLSQSLSTVLNVGNTASQHILMGTYSIGFGTISPSASLHIVGSGGFRYVDGVQTSGYILTTDSNGVASWTSSGNIISGTGQGIYAGSGTVPTSTVVTLSNNITFSNGEVDIIGNGSTSATKSLSIKNSSLQEMFYVRDDNTSRFYGSLDVIRLSGLGSPVFSTNSLTGFTNISKIVSQNFETRADVNTYITSGLLSFQVGAYIQTYQQQLIIKKAYPDSITSTTLELDNGTEGGQGTTPTLHKVLSLKYSGVENSYILGDGNIHSKGLTIISNGSTSATKSLSIKNSSLAEKFYVRDDGMVSATDGYSINGTLFLHNTFGGVQDATKGNTLLGYLTPTGAAGTVYDGANNTAIGSLSMQTLTNGFDNTAVGSGSLNKITIGRDNVAIGQLALYSLTSGTQINESYNTAIGGNSYISLITGFYNSGLGLQCGANITGGNGTTCVGYGTGGNLSGSYNFSIALGAHSKFNASNQMVVGEAASGAYINEAIFGAGIEQTAIGPTSFKLGITNIVAGNLDVSSGYDFIYKTSAGTGAGLGGKHIFQVAPAGATGTNQNAFVDAMTINQDRSVQIQGVTDVNLFYTDAINNRVGIGTALPTAKVDIVGSGSTSATKSLSIKNSSLAEKFYVRDDGMVSATDGYSINGLKVIHQGVRNNGISIYVGYRSGISDVSTLSQYNVGIGFAALQTLNNNVGNTAVGAFALQNYTSQRATAIGNAALQSLTNGIANTGIGDSTLYGITNGISNTALGFIAGSTIIVGSYNTIVGSRAGTNSLQPTTLNSCILLGFNAYATASNQMVIGSGSGGATINEVFIGQGVEDNAINPSSMKLGITSIKAGNLDVSSGYDFIYKTSAGTGAGLGGKHIFQVAPAGATGTNQNAFVDAMSIQQDGVVVYKSFLKASLPTPVAGGVIRVSDEIGGDTLAYADGVNWKRMSDGAIVA